MLALFSTSPAYALPQLRVVTNTNDSGDGSLRQAIFDADSSNSGDTIAFQSGLTGTITLTSGSLVIEDSLTINGPGASTLAISGGGSSQVFVVDMDATVSISGLTIESGSTKGSDGGGIESFGTLTVTDSVIADNSAHGGGGISSFGTLTLTNATIFENDSDGAIGAGGIDIRGAATLTNVNVSENIAGGGAGGGISVSDNATVTIVNSTVSNNTCESGGGISLDSGSTLTITNSTVFGNSATLDGGGVRSMGALTITNSTISGNNAKANEGGGIEFGGVTKLKNTIVASNPMGGNCDSNGGLTSFGHNLSDDSTCDSFLTGTGDLNETPAGLDPGGLKDNGGPTLTVALMANSAAVDAVPVTPTNFCTPLTTDQRGMTRPLGAACDIGSFERAPTPVAGRLKISPKKLNFGTVTVNQPKTMTVKIANAGKIKKKNQPLPILIEMESVAGSPFSVRTECVDNDLQPKGKGVPASATSCEVAVQFEPTDAVSYKGTLMIIDNLEPTGMQTVQLAGKGRASK
jgi:hypothetical protein